MLKEVCRDNIPDVSKAYPWLQIFGLFLLLPLWLPMLLMGWRPIPFLGSQPPKLWQGLHDSPEPAWTQPSLCGV